MKRQLVKETVIIPRPVRNCAFQVFRCAPPIVGTAPCGCPSRIIGISHGTAQGLSPTDPQNNPQFLPRINAIFPDAEYNKRTLLFYRLENGSYTLVVERSGMSWGSFLTLEEAEAFARRHMQGGEVNDVSRQGASLR